MKRVKIKNLPKQVHGGESEAKNQMPYIDNTAAPNYDIGDIGSDHPIQVNKTLTAVPREEANLEAEKGETAVTDLNNDGLPEFYHIGGKPHSKGGTPLNLPENSFIYSKDKSLACKDPEILKQFGKKATKKKKKYTPAELSKTYDINKYRKVLADPDSDPLQISTAETMIKNYMDKLGALALVQESKKGFDNGIPEISKPYLKKVGITSQDIMPPPPPMPPQQQAPQMPPQGPAPDQMAMSPQGIPSPNEPVPQVVNVPGGQFIHGGEHDDDSPTGADPGVGNWLTTTEKTTEKFKGAFDDKALVGNIAMTAGSLIPNMFGAGDEAELRDELERRTVMAGAQVQGADQGSWGMNNRQFKAKDQEYPVQFGTYTGGQNISKYGGEYRKGGPIPAEDKEYIDRIIQYELNHGSSTGKGLSYADWSKGNATDKASAERFIYDTYVAPLEDLNLPLEVRKRAVDFFVNSENPKASMMVAAGIITPQQKGQLYKGGKLDNAAVDALYEQNKGKMRRAIKQDNFVNAFDAEKHRSYRNTNNADVSYNATWGPRVDMWENDYSYETWTPESALKSNNASQNFQIDAYGNKVFSGDNRPMTPAPAPNSNPTNAMENDNSYFGKEIELQNNQTVKKDPSGNNVVIDQTTGQPVQDAGPSAGDQDPSANVVTKSSTKSTRRQNIPKDATLWDVDAEGYDPAAVQVGDYVKHDGKWFKQTKKVYKPYDGPNVDEMDPKLNGAYGDMREPYGRLVQKFNTDEDVRSSFLANFNKEIDALKPTSGRTQNITQADIDMLKGLSDQEKIDYFLNGNKHHMMIAAQMGDVTNVKNVGKWDEGDVDENGIPKNYKAAIGQVGLNPMSKGQTLGFQSGYIALQKMYDDPELKGKLKNFALPKTGVADDSGAGHKNISKADGWEGNTTAGQMMLWNPKDFTLEEEEAEWIEDEQEDPKTKSIQKIKRNTDAPFWTQDVLNTVGAVGDFLSVEKRNPWQAKPQFQRADPTFADFRGAASRIGSQLQSGAQQAAAFGNPQAFGSTFANMQRNAAQQIGQLQDQEYKANVGTANQFELANTDAANRQAIVEADLATKLYDKQMIADQQYDNAKRAMKWNAIGAFNNALTNRGMTQSMNERTDQFQVDPRTGFTTFVGEDRAFLPGSGSTASVAEQTAATAASIKEKYPDMEWKDATALAKVGVPTGTRAGLQQPTTDPYGVPIGTMYPGANQRNRRGGFGYQGGFNPYTQYRRTGRVDQFGNRIAGHGGSMGGKKKCRMVRLPRR